MENVNGKYIHVIHFNTLLNISQCIRFTATAWLQANAYRMTLFVHIHKRMVNVHHSAVMGY